MERGLRADSGRASVGIEELARRDSELALRLGRLGMEGSGEERKAGEELAKAALLERGARGGRAAELDVEAFLELSRSGLEWAGPLRKWAEANASRLLKKCGREGAERLEGAYPGFLSGLSAKDLRAFPEAAAALLARGKLKAGRMREILEAEGGSPGRGTEELCAKADPEWLGKAWGEKLAREAERGSGGWWLAAEWAGMGEEEARAAARGIAERMGKEGSARLLLLMARACEGLGDPNVPAGAREGGERFLRSLGRELGGSALGRKALPWAGKAGTLARGREKEWSIDTRVLATGSALRMADFPMEWALGTALSPRIAQEREAMALAWWEGWREGGGEEPGIWVSFAERGEASGRRMRSEAAALALGAAKMEGAARWMLMESGWGSEEGIEEALRLRADLESRGMWKASEGMAALLEGARIGRSAAGAMADRGAGRGRRL